MHLNYYCINIVLNAISYYYGGIVDTMCTIIYIQRGENFEFLLVLLVFPRNSFVV